MTIRELCIKISLPEELTEAVVSFSDTYDFESIRPQLESLKKLETSDAALGELNKILEPDEKKVKMLSCMLKCASEQYDVYCEKRISDEIYIETMKCFSRFAEECKVKTGVYAFDREWWTARQVGMLLFRIGELEYEMVQFKGKPAVSVHIPSDADLSVEKCDESLQSAGKFFEAQYPEYVNAEYICDSWLLSPALEELLSPDSNILKFKNRFEILEVNPEPTDVAEWVFKTNEYQPENFPENTTLQKKMKNFILAGGKVGIALGKIR